MVWLWSVAAHECAGVAGVWLRAISVSAGKPGESGFTDALEDTTEFYEISFHL